MGNRLKLFGAAPAKTVLTGITVAQAAAAQANSTVSAFSITDTAANVLAGLASLVRDTKLTSIALADSSAPTFKLTGAAYSADAAVLAKIVSPYALNISGATAAQAAAIQANPHVTGFTLTDTAAHVQSALASLLSDTKVTSITLSDTRKPALTLSATDYAADASVLAKIVSPYNLTVSSATAAQAALLQADAHVGSFSISDTAANIQANLAGLNADTHLKSVSVSNGQPVVMTYGQYQADSSLVAKLGAGTIDVTGVGAVAAATVAANSHVKAEAVADTLANIGLSLDALEALAKAGKLTGIAITDVGQSLTISQSQYAADIDAIKLLSGQFTINQVAATPGLHFHFVYDASMANAPAAYVTALNTAAAILSSEITDTMTLNIEVGWGTIGGTTPIPGSVAEGGTLGDIYQTYATVSGELAAHMSGPAAATLLPTSDPFGAVSYDLSGAQAKAWGLTAADATGLDGLIGVSSSGWPSTDYVGVLLHELTHAMGRNSGWGGTNADTTTLDLYRYSAPGVRVTDGSLVDPSLHSGASSLQYFSLDGGKTVLAGYSNTSDYGDWASNSLTLHDPNNAFLSSGSNALTAVDLVQIGAEGFHLSSGAVAAIAASGLHV